MSDLANAITNTVNGALNTAVNAANAAVNAAVNAAEVGIAQINAALAGPAVLDFAYGKSVLNAPVGPGVVINLPSNTGSQLAMEVPADCDIDELRTQITDGVCKAVCPAFVSDH